MSSNSHRARLMFVTLTAARLERALSPVLEAVHAWLDSWKGIGSIERGMARQGYDLQLTRYDNSGWRATFYTSVMEHTPRVQSARAARKPSGMRCGRRRGRRFFTRQRNGPLTDLIDGSTVCL